MITFFKTIFLWILNPLNRQLGFKLTQEVLTVLSEISSLTDTKKDDLIIGFFCNELKKITENKTDQEVIDLINLINSQKDGKLKDVEIKNTSEGLNLKFNEIQAAYDPKDGSVQLLGNIKF